MTFYEATRTAMTFDDLDRAGKDFATGLAEVGVGTLMMILSVVGARQGLKMAKGAAARAHSGPKETPAGKPAREPEPKPRPAKRNYRDDPRFEELRKDPQTGKPTPNPTRRRDLSGVRMENARLMRTKLFNDKRFRFSLPAAITVQEIDVSPNGDASQLTGKDGLDGLRAVYP